ncbi:MAG: hypothetical protein JXA14_22170 [Anaerolineae bacterium]|nr:hypothetical protein [Anaerolineae bacterium]
MEIVRRASVRFLISTVAILASLAATLLLLPVQTVWSLPPRPTLPSEPPPGATGSAIELRAQFPPAWPWNETDWQDLWTIVQWQGNEGNWHNVEGWQGTFDMVKVDEDGEVMGQKTWWVGASDLGKGPFRWQVYRGKGGMLVATSEPFDLPDATGLGVTIEVVLAP